MNFVWFCLLVHNANFFSCDYGLGWLIGEFYAIGANANPLPNFLIIFCSPLQQLPWFFTIKQHPIILHTQAHTMRHNEDPFIDKTELNQITNHRLRNFSLLEDDQSIGLFLRLMVEESIFPMRLLYNFFQLLQVCSCRCPTRLQIMTGCRCILRVLFYTGWLILSLTIFHFLLVSCK